MLIVMAVHCLIPVKFSYTWKRDFVLHLILLFYLSSHSSSPLSDHSPESCPCKIENCIHVSAVSHVAMPIMLPPLVYTWNFYSCVKLTLIYLSKNKIKLRLIWNNACFQFWPCCPFHFSDWNWSDTDSPNWHGESWRMGRAAGCSRVEDKIWRTW